MAAVEFSSEAATAPGAALHFNIRKLSGAQEQVSVSPECSLDEFRDRLRTLGLVPPQHAFSLLTDAGQLLRGGTATLASLALADASGLTVLMGRARDYGSITGFDHVLTGCRYPQGVLTNDRGELFVCYYYGEIKVFNENFEPLLQSKMAAYTPPTQMAFGPNGELVMGTNSRIVIYEVTASDMTLLRTMGSGRYMGIAVHGDLIFAADAFSDNVQVFSFSTGELQDTWTGFNHPCGLEVVGDDLLAVADRRNNQIVICDFKGERVRTFSACGVGSSLVLPNDVAVDSDGNLLVIDTGNERIAVFDQHGAFLGAIMPGFFKNRGNTYSYLSVNPISGAVSVSFDDEHKVVVLKPPLQA